MVWLLLALLVLAVLVLLGLTLLSLWRRVKVLGRSVATAAETVADASAALDGARAGGPLAPKPSCATCGAPASAARPELVSPAG